MHRNVRCSYLHLDNQEFLPTIKEEELLVNYLLHKNFLGVSHTIQTCTNANWGCISGRPTYPTLFTAQMQQLYLENENFAAPYLINYCIKSMSGNAIIHSNSPLRCRYNWHHPRQTNLGLVLVELYVALSPLLFIVAEKITIKLHLKV